MIDIHKTVHDSINGKSRNALRTKLKRYILAMGYNGGKTHAQFLSNFLIKQAGCDTMQHLMLTRSES